MEPMNLLVRHAKEMGIHLTPGHIKAFGTYQRELLDWNQRVNLTAITQEDHIEIRHFLDSLTCLVAVRQFFSTSQRARSGEGALRLLDVGAGAGFPGIPLQIVCPQWQVTLLEATGKKVQFLQHMRDMLGLKGLEVIHGRAEDLARDPAHRERYDWVAARAVAEMPVLAELTLPFARIGGMVVAMKSATAEAEAAAAGRALALLGGQLAKVIALQLPGLAEERRLVVVRKVACTPDAYPRRPGMPAKRPLK
jgi:16S rRNA (guanine527-N7)-methyltransferase